MKVQQYLENQLKLAGKYKLSEEDKKLLDQGVVAFAMRKLMSKKFRKWKLDPACIERSQKAVELQVSKNEPIKVIYFQGGYKLWRFPSSPEVDWAEFFNIAYVLNYLAPIATAYKPGIDLTYYCHTLLMETHDNLTTREIKAYMDSFQRLLNEFGEYTPKNIKMSILRDADIYSRKEYFEALEKGKDKASEDIKAWPEAKVRDFERMARLNIKWKGKDDWTILSEIEKEEKIHKAALYEQAATSNLPRVMDTVKAPNIVLLFTKATPIFIGIGSTYASIAKHWVGYGVLEVHNESYIPRILTSSQFEKVKTQEKEKVSISLGLGKNFSVISVYPQHLTLEKY